MTTTAQANYSLLIEKLDQFIRKYYLNQLIKGSLYFLGLVLFLFIAFNVLEYYFYFGTGVRKLMFYSFIGTALGSMIYWIMIPAMHFLHLGKVISHAQAATIIGTHFHSVEDKLLNILQLHDQASSSQNSLVLASIEQKSESIRLVPFKNAIDLTKNKKYLRFALPPMLLLLVILFAAPSLIPESSKRLFNNNTVFERKAPFDFIIENEDLIVPQSEDFELRVKLEGDALPAEVFVQIADYQYRLTKENATEYSYIFKNVQRNTPFQLYGSGYNSTQYELSVLAKPAIAGFQTILKYPAYTGRKNETLFNTGDISVPVGTKVSWIFDASFTDQLEMSFEKSLKVDSTVRSGSQQFSFTKTVVTDDRYSIYLSNAQLSRADSFSYSIHTIPDLYPSIQAEQMIDSADNDKIVYFVGEASDDYGIRTVTFHYTIQKAGNKQSETKSKLIQGVAGKQTDFSYIWDMNELKIEPGDNITYYFEVADNDAVFGSKKTKTQLFQVTKPTLKEFEEKLDQNSKDIKETLMKSMAETKKLKEDFQKLREKVLQQKELDWQRKKELEKLLERQKEIDKQIKEAKDKFQENKKNQEELNQMDESIKEKQDKLEELFEKVVDNETQALMDKIKELMQELGKEDAMQMMENMQNESKESEMEMDRLLELYKTLEMEMEMKKQAEALEKLAEKQEQLAKETAEKKTDSEELSKKQEEINKEFNDIQKKMDEMEKKNKELERPKNLDDPQNEMEGIKPDLKDAKEQLDKKQPDKAGKPQKKAAQKMKDAAKKMAQSQQSGEMDQMQEDIKALRQLLENIVGLSLEQEQLINQFASVNSNTPAYTRLVQDQDRIKNNFRLVEDSLQAISKRVFQLESFITEKVNEINKNITHSIDKLEERKKTEAADNQQRSMKNLNDLALMLSETMEQMQKAMSQMMPGTQMCTNPGQSSGKEGMVPMDKITEGQQKLTEEMKKMKEAREKGKPGGEGKEGKDGKDGKEGGESKEFAEIAAQQAKLRKALEGLQKEKQMQGKGDKGLQEIIDQMNQNEIDLVNKRLSNEMIKRQQDILTRLLEAEKATREQDWDEKRKAQQAQNAERAFPPSMDTYLKQRKAETEMFKTVSPSLKPYYKNLVEDYYRSLQGR